MDKSFREAKVSLSHTYIHTYIHTYKHFLHPYQTHLVLPHPHYLPHPPPQPHTLLTPLPTPSPSTHSPTQSRSVTEARTSQYIARMTTNSLEVIDPSGRSPSTLISMQPSQITVRLFLFFSCSFPLLFHFLFHTFSLPFHFPVCCLLHGFCLLIGSLSCPAAPLAGITFSSRYFPFSSGKFLLRISFRPAVVFPLREVATLIP